MPSRSWSIAAPAFSLMSRSGIVRTCEENLCFSLAKMITLENILLYLRLYNLDILDESLAT